MGGFNIGIKRKGVVSKNLSDFCDLFHLTNVVKFTTCFTKIHISLIEFISTNERHLLIKHSLREKCPNTEFFLARIFPHSDWIWENTDQKKLRIWTLFTRWLVSETDLSDHHKMITAFIKLDFSRLRPKLITYANYKKFHEVKFLNYLKEMNIRIDPNQKYQSLTNTFSQTCSFKKENYENYPTIINKKA